MDVSPYRSTPSPHDHGLHAEILKNDLLLHEAVIKNDAEEVKAILKEPCDVNSRNNYGRAPIHWAASRGNTDLIQLLMNAGCDIEARDKYGMRPLLMAAWHGHLDAVKQLLAAGAVVSSVNKQQHNLLMCATRNRCARLEVVEHVLGVLDGSCPSKRTSVSSTARGRRSPSSRKMSADVLDVQSLTLHNVRRASLTPHDAPDDADDARFMPGVEARDVDGRTALHHAALAGHALIVERLIRAGADINSVDNLLRSPLHSACSQGHVDVAELALERGALLDARDSEGDAPLHAAAQAQHADLVRALVAAGSNPDHENSKGLTALHIATSLGCRGIIDCLLHAGASLNKQALNGNTALHIACHTNNIDIIELYIAKGADLDCLNMRLESAMHVAAARGDAAACRALLAAGAGGAGGAGGGGGGGGGGGRGAGGGAARGSSGAVSGAASEALSEAACSPLLAAARGSFTAIVDMIIKTARLDYPPEGEEFDTARGTTSTIKPILNISRRKWKSSQEDVAQTNEQALLKDVLWKLAYRQLVTGEWKKLACHWSFTDEQIKAIEHQYTGPSSYKEHGYRMLLIWQHSLPANVNPIKELGDSLTAIGKKNMAETLKKMYEQSSSGKSNGKCNCINCSIT